MDREAPALAWRAEGLWQPCATLIGPGTPRISLPVRQTAAWQAARLEQLFPPIAGQPTTLPLPPFIQTTMRLRHCDAWKF